MVEHSAYGHSLTFSFVNAGFAESPQSLLHTWFFFVTFFVSRQRK